MHKSSVVCNISKVIDILLALFLILNCQSLYQNSATSNYHIYEITLMLILISMLLHGIQNPLISKEKANHTAMYSLIYFFIAVFILIVDVSTSDWLSYSARFLIAPIILFYFLPMNNLKNKVRLMRYFVFWTVLITLVSLFFFILGTNLNLISPTGTFRYHWGNILNAQSYYNLYFGGVQYADSGILNGVLYRNTAIFVEGPMYAAVLDLALFFLYILKNDFKFFKTAFSILMIGIITSNSTTAIIIGIILTFFMFRDTSFAKKSKNIIILPIMIIIVFLLIEIISIKAGSFSSTSSFGIRNDDYIAGFQAWIRSPILGWGYNNLSVINFFRENAANAGFSNSIFAILNSGGLLFGSLYLFPIFHALWRKKRNHMQVEFSLIYFLLLILVLFYTSYINFFIWALLLDDYFWDVCKKKGIIND